MKCEVPDCKGQRRQGERYCSRCAREVLARLKRAGYLTPLPATGRPTDPEVEDMDTFNAFVKDQIKGRKR